jgi:hypothetical protein
MILNSRGSDRGGADEAMRAAGRVPQRGHGPDARIDLPGGRMEAGEARIVQIIMLAVICGGIALLVFAGSIIGFGAVFVGSVGLLAPQLERGPAGPRPKTTPIDAAWTRARKRLDAVSAEYAAYECDPREVLRLPALADVRVPSTATFVDAFANAQALRTDAPPPAGDATEFIAAVNSAERAWRAARETAARIELDTLSPQEQASITRIGELLTAARDSDSEPERHAAYVRARAELATLTAAGTIRMPERAQAALDTAARRELAP